MRRLVIAAAVALSPTLALAQATSSGSVRVPDGNDKALGSTGDNAWSGTGSGTAIAILKSLWGQAVPLGTAGNPQSGSVLTVQGVAAMTPLFVGHALNTAIGSINGAPVIQGSVSTSAPTYTNGNTNALSLTTAGSLRTSITDGTIAAIGSVGDAAYDWGGGNATVVSALKGLGDLALNTGTAGTPANDVLTVQGCSACTGVKVGDSFGASASGKAGVGVQGLVTTNAPSYSNGTLNGLSLDEAGNLRVTGNFGGTAQGASSSGVQGPMVQSVTTTSAPTYSSNTVNALSTDAQGNLRVAAAGGDVCQRRPHTFTPISTTAGAVLRAGTSSKITYICSIMLIANAAETISVVSGTGTTCGTSTDAVIGSTTAVIGLAANQGFALGSGGYAVAASSSGEDICLLKSGSVQVSGVMVTAVEP
jgi:hypothetical protein